jgi:hypothetical protein
MTPIDRLIDSVPMTCTVCGARAGTCRCWEECSCGWSTRRGEPCRNPETTRCSTKLKYRPLPAVRRGDRVRLIPDANFMPCDARWGGDGYYAEVMATPRSGSDTVAVRWDGRTSSDRVAQWWLEKVG